MKNLELLESCKEEFLLIKFFHAHKTFQAFPGHPTKLYLLDKVIETIHACNRKFLSRCYCCCFKLPQSSFRSFISLFTDALAVREMKI